MIRTIFAFIAMALTGSQAYLLYSKGSGICFGDGCEIVEKLTTVPSLYFNLLGALFFGVVFVGSLWSYISESKDSQRYVGLLLTAALAAEAVLIFFQWSVARTWCSYCLIIFSLVLLLVLFSGWQQIVQGVVVFAAVLVAAFSLQFEAGGVGKSLRFGTMAHYQEEGNERDLLLIFSESCSHCEKIIDFLREGSICNVAFNPIEKMKDFTFNNSVIKENYDPQASIGFMQSVGMSGIPIMLAPADGGGFLILNGADQIMPYVQKNCQMNISPLLENEMSRAPKIEFEVSSPSSTKDDVCGADPDC